MPQANNGPNAKASSWFVAGSTNVHECGCREDCSGELTSVAVVDERKVVSPRHDGHKRIYLPEEVVEITVIAELRRKGFSLQKIRRVLRFLQREMGRRLADVLSSDSRLHLLTDGKAIYLEDQQARIIDLFKDARQPMVLVSVSDQAKRLDEIPKKTVRSEAAPLARRIRAAI